MSDNKGKGRASVLWDVVLDLGGPEVLGELLQEKGPELINGPLRKFVLAHAAALRIAGPWECSTEASGTHSNPDFKGWSRTLLGEACHTTKLCLVFTSGTDFPGWSGWIEGCEDTHWTSLLRRNPLEASLEEVLSTFDRVLEERGYLLIHRGSRVPCETCHGYGRILTGESGGRIMRIERCPTCLRWGYGDLVLDGAGGLMPRGDL